jgi:D-glycero-D-manno-heptose 1,7-bisphosphate phosphatase
VKQDRKNRRPAAFLDRDGVINIDRGYVYRREDFDFVPGVLEGAQRLHELGYALVVASNQSGIGRGLYSESDFQALSEWMKTQFLAAGAPLSGIYYCPHHPTDATAPYLRACECRKPAPGMLLTAACDLNLDLPSSAMFGDRLSDLEAARTAGIPLRVLLGTDGGAVQDIAAGDLVTAAFDRLDQAVADPALFATGSVSLRSA